MTTFALIAVVPEIDFAATSTFIDMSYDWTSYEDCS